MTKKTKKGENHAMSQGVNSSKLLGCPFCGSYHLSRHYDGTSTAPESFYILCLDCGARGGKVNNDDCDRHKSICAWNRRAT